MNMKQQFLGCWFCDNLVDFPDYVGLLYLGFPRCFVLFRESADLYFGTFESFKNGAAEINWLDPNDKGTEAEREEVLRLLWNFSVEQEAEEDRLAEEREADEDWP